MRQSQPFITAGMLHLSETSAPELKLKAYHARIFIAFLADCLETHMNNNAAAAVDPDFFLSLAATAGLANWHLELEVAGRYLSQAQAEGLHRRGMQFLDTYRLLARRHAQSGSLLFPLKPRHHAFVEINKQVLRWRYNPRFKHCFKDEDMLGIVKHIVRRCHRQMLEIRGLCRLSLRYKQAPPDMSRHLQR